ncbi:MAG: hypothetical protein ACE5IZ_10310, partial [Dehalococcoidia bacterium]
EGLYRDLAAAAAAFGEAEARLLGEVPKPEEGSNGGPAGGWECPWADDGCPAASPRVSKGVRDGS